MSIEHTAYDLMNLRIVCVLTVSQINKVLCQILLHWLSSGRITSMIGRTGALAQVMCNPIHGGFWLVNGPPCLSHVSPVIIIARSHENNVFIFRRRREDRLTNSTDALLENVGRNWAPLMHTRATLPWDWASVEGSVNVKERFDCFALRGARRPGREVLASKLRAVAATADARVPAQPYLSSVHDGWVVSDKVFAVFAVLCDDRVPGFPRGFLFVAGTTALVDFKQTPADGIGTDVTDTVSSPSESGRGRCIVHPWVGQNAADGDPCCCTGVQHSWNEMLDSCREEERNRKLLIGLLCCKESQLYPRLPCVNVCINMATHVCV